MEGQERKRIHCCLMLGNLEHGAQASEAVIGNGEACEAVGDAGLVVRVKEDVGGLTALQVVVDALADDGRWVGDVVEECLVDGAEGTAVRADRAVTAALLASLREGAALADDHDLIAWKLLLDFTDQVAGDLAVRGNLRVGDRNDGNLDAVGFGLLDTGDLQEAHGLLHGFL